MAGKIKPLSEEDLFLLKMSEDPVLWAEYSLHDPRPGKAHLPIILRDYQKEILKNPSYRKATRMGRRVGKCLSKDASVITKNGPIRAEDLYNLIGKPEILTFNQDTLKIENTSDYFIWKNGVKPVYKLQTSLGRNTEVTGNHPFCILDKDGLLDWKALEDLRVGDRIAVPSTYNDLIGSKEIGRNTSRLLGYLVGGRITQREITFSNTDKEILNDLSDILIDYDSFLKPSGSKKGDFSYSISGNISSKSSENKIRKLCDDNGLYIKENTEKEVPSSIKVSILENVADFLGAYWDCNGWVQISKSGKIEIGTSSYSHKLATGIQHLLLRFGINSTVRHRDVKYKESTKESWLISVVNKNDIEKFILNIKTILKSKENEIILDKIKNRKTPTSDIQSTIPRSIFNYIDSISEVSDREIEKSIGYKLRRAYPPIKDKLSGYSEYLDDPYLKDLCNSDIIWDEIKSINYIGEKETYDLSVPETSTLINDDIISHNTTTMVVHILWYAYTHNDSKQLISTPYDAQIQMIFDMIRGFLRNSPGLMGSIKDNTKNPSRITLTNGSIISGFTAGTKSGSKGGSMRGQAADWIYLDEVDYMDDASFEAITAVAIERPDIGIWVASTPTGRRGMFWKICTGKIVKNIRNEVGEIIDTQNVWKEFYHPSMDNPMWNKDMEDEFRSMFDEETYKHEVCLTPGQLIITENGLVPIEDIEVGDMVLTHRNRYRSVKTLFKRIIEEDVYKIETELGTITCTHNHPIYMVGKTKEKWLRADKLKPGDSLLCNPGTSKYLSTYNNYEIIPIISITKELYDGRVYNVEVDEDNSYSIEGKIVHNCAEFGEETVGVFRKNLIDIARKKYSYKEFEPGHSKHNRKEKTGPRIMGVDWDKYANASQAVVLEYNVSKRKFIVIARNETPKSKFTLTNAVNRIIKMNEEYDLDFIYVDRGYGEHQVETLHKYGMDHPESGLKTKVFGVQFSEVKEIRDPYTKKFENVPIKPFMVNQLVNLFEAIKIEISEYDEMIIRQLENYQVIKKSLTGQPIYTSSDEHALDCMMLCAFGFTEKFPEIISDIFVIKNDYKIAKLDKEKDNNEVLNEIANKIIDGLDEDLKTKVHLSGYVGPKRIDSGSRKRDTPSFKRKKW